MDISAPDLIQQLCIASSSFPDNRTGANTRYTMEDIVLGAFSVFFTQSPSFLAFQRGMQEQTGRNNGTSLFSIQSLPTDDQIRNVLDDVSPELLFPVLTSCLDQVIQTGEIKQFKSEMGYLIALDGTQYFSSDHINCKNCLHKTDKKTGNIIYYHTAITPVIVKPESEYVFSLIPEFITPQDGHEKQDCENAAAKRWLNSYGKHLAHISQDEETTVLGDDLYSRQPVIQAILDQDLHYILVCKRESHQWLYDWVDNLEKETEATPDAGSDVTQAIHTITQRKWNGTTHIVSIYKYANHVPLKDSIDSLSVNWCEVTIKSEESGKLIYHNAFISDRQITDTNAADIILCGRTRWKIENENNNTLKTKGYHFEHNYGHGKAYLSTFLTTLILIAFLFHTLFSLFWQPYIHIMERVKRQRLFEAIRTLTQFYYAPNWQHLFAGMEYALDHVIVLPVPFSILPAP